MSEDPWCCSYDQRGELCPGCKRMNEDRRGLHITPVGSLMAQVDLGDGAVMSVLNPCSFENGGLQWKLRYGNMERARYLAASIVSDYDALTSDAMSITEATRRLRILRRARRMLAEGKDET